MMATGIDDLRFFVRLVEAGGLSEAARRLHSSPPAMSRRLAALEAGYGVRLVERSSRRFGLTDEGALLHARALRIVEDMDDLETELGAKTGEASGFLRIGAPMEIGRRRIAALISTFKQLKPKVSCELVLSDAGQDPVRDELDFAFRTTRPEDPGVVCLTLVSSRRVVCAAPSYLAKHGQPDTPDQLVEHDCLRLVRGRWVFDRWRFSQAGTFVEVSVKGTLSSTSGEIIHDWALEGQGVAFKAGWDVVEDLQVGRLVECLAPFASDELHLYGVFAARSRQPLRLRTLIDFLRNRFASNTRLR